MREAVWAARASAAGGWVLGGSFERSRARFWLSARIAPHLAAARMSFSPVPASKNRLTWRSRTFAVDFEER